MKNTLLQEFMIAMRLLKPLMDKKQEILGQRSKIEEIFNNISQILPKQSWILKI